MVYFENEDNRYRLWLVVGVIYDLFCTPGLPNGQFRVSIKPDMNMSFCDLSFYYATVFIPWDLRALYGILSDAVPLFRSPRKLNIIGCYILTSCFILLFAIEKSKTSFRRVCCWRVFESILRVFRSCPGCSIDRSSSLEL